MKPTPIGRSAVNPEDILSILPERHIAAFGKTGVGKTALLRNIATWNFHHDSGLTVLDPHGSLVRDLLEMVPSGRTNDVIYFNPLEPSRALGLNLLETNGHQQKPLVVSALISIMKNIWPENWGPRTEFILANSAHALLAQPQPVSLLAIQKLSTNDQYRQSILRHVSDPAVLSFFHLYDNQWAERFREEAIAPLLNKLSALTLNPLLRSIIGQIRSSFDFRWMMDRKKIFLVDLSKGALGADVSSLLGSLIVTKLSLAALSRQDIPESERVPHLLIADEVQNFIHGVDFPTVLSEARKYKLSLAIATQTIASLEPKTVAAVLGNCATLMSFRVSGEDAQTISREFAMVIPASELQSLNDYTLYLRTLRKGKSFGPHLLQTFPPFERTGSENTPERIIRTSLERYGRSRAEVETKLKKFLSH